MPRRQFQVLARHLLDSGIKPRYVTRIQAELRDHYAELIREARTSGMPAHDAIADARARLGDQAVITEEFLAQPELRSWMYRSTWMQNCVRLGLSITALLIYTVRSLLTRQHVIARYGAAVTCGVVMTGGTLLLMQLAFTANSLAGHRASDVGVIAISVASEAAMALEKPISATDENAIERLRTLTERAERPTLEVYESAVFGGNQPVLNVDLDIRLIVGVAPVYPTVALTRGLEGYVVLEFTVTPSGAVQNVLVVEATDTLFEKSAIRAAYKLKYEPRYVNGEPVQASGIRHKITFMLEA